MEKPTTPTVKPTTPQTSGMLDIWKREMITNYSNFAGRTSRRNYWTTALVNAMFIIGFIIALVVLSLAGNTVAGVASVILGIGVIVLTIGILIPTLAIATRRLHDTNKTGWLQLLGFIPFGGLALFVFYVQAGNEAANNYGEPQA